jgi:CPA2 family monovalent cation:H+ antiporter-2
MAGTEIILLLAVAMAGLVAAHAVRLPPIVGYLAAGVLVGPGGLGLVAHSEPVERLAELGVALLLFGVGIEFSLERMRRTLGRMLASGGAQIAVTVGLTAVAFRLLGEPWPVSVFTGLLVSLSSTAIVFKLYTDAGEIDAPHGQAAAGILLVQDLALVPMVLLTPLLAQPGDGVLGAAALALAKAAGAIALILVLARAALPRALGLVARVGTPELFPLAALVAAFGTAACAVALGLSLPIGAFLAGLALSGNRYAHQVFAELLPLRDAFVAIFFTSIGMLFRPAVVLAAPAALAGMVLAALGKGFVIAAIVGLLWRSSRLAILTGFGLAQIGEFSFVLAHQGVAAGVITERLSQGFLGAAIVTMGLTPLLVGAARRLVHLGTGARSAPPGALRDHVLVLGCGTTGSAVARVLKETGLVFAAVDLLAEHVEAARREGLPVRFGDASRRAVLEEMGAGRARAAVVTVGEPAATRRIVSVLRQMNASARILVRVQRVAEIDELERLGADDVVPSEFETSIELFARLLTHLGVPKHVVRIQESIIRTEHYRALRGLGTTAAMLAETGRLVAGGILETARVMAESAAAGRTLAELDLRRRTGALVLSVVRAERPLPTPDGPTRLQADDLVVLYGPHDAIDRALGVLEASLDPGTASGDTR